MSEYKQLLLDLFKEDNRNTKRKRINTLNKELAELDWRIKHIQEGIDSKQRKDILGYYSLLYGDKYYMRDLQAYKDDAQCIRDNWNELISIE